MASEEELEVEGLEAEGVDVADVNPLLTKSVKELVRREEPYPQIRKDGSTNEGYFRDPNTFTPYDEEALSLPPERTNEYVYDTQCHAAEQTLASIIEMGNNWVHLVAQMQSGKTGVMRQLTYLLTHTTSAHCRELQRRMGLTDDSGSTQDFCWVINAISDSLLLEQTRLTLGTIPGFDAANRVFHTPQIKEMEKWFPKMRQKSVIMHDESHYGSNSSGRMSKIFDKLEAPAYFDGPAMKKNELYVVSVSATPFPEMGENAHADVSDGVGMVRMETGNGYYGVSDMLRRTNPPVLVDTKSDRFCQRLFKAYKPPKKTKTKATKGGGKGKEEEKKEEHTLLTRKEAAEFRTTMDELVGKMVAIRTQQKGGKGYYAFVRAGGTKEKMAWRGRFQQHMATHARGQVLVLEWDTEKGNSDVLSTYNKAMRELYPDTWQDVGVGQGTGKGQDHLATLLAVEPPLIVVILIKAMLKCGKSIKTGNVGLVLEYPANASNVDTVVQGLVGRCCGYGKRDDNVTIWADRLCVELYAAWVQDPTHIPEGRKPNVNFENNMYQAQQTRHSKKGKKGGRKRSILPKWIKWIPCVS